MNIAIFAEVFLPKVDGIVNTLCYLLRHLEEQGHRAIIFAPDKGEDTPTEYAGMPVVKFRPIPFPMYPEMPIVPPLRPRLLDKHLADFQPDIIHVVNPVFMGMSAIRWAKRKNIPIVASYHTDMAGFAKRWGLDFLIPFIWWFTRRTHKQADLNLAPSKTTLNYLDDHGIKRLGIWTRGVNTELFHPSKRSCVWRKKVTNGNPDAPSFLFVGRVAPEKRVHWLRPLLDAIPNAHLVVVGDGPARGEMETLFEGTNTTFTGYLHGEELAAAFASADIFTFPSPNETFGNVILEGMASGLPPVCAASGGPLDFVVPNENGLLFDAESESAFIEAVQSMVADQTLCQQLADGALKTAEARSWSAVLDELIDDYQQLIDHSSMGINPHAMREAG